MNTLTYVPITAIEAAAAGSCLRYPITRFIAQAAVIPSQAITQPDTVLIVQGSYHERDTY